MDNPIDYPAVENAISNIIRQNQRPTLEKIKEQLHVGSENTFNEIIEYYHYMWEQRHTTTYLENLANRAMFASTYGIILLENKENFPSTYLNPACSTLLNIDEARVLQHSFLDTINGFLPHRDQFLDILQVKKSGALTIQYPAGKKIMWLEIKIDPVYEKDQKTISHFICIMNDVSRNKELESILLYKAVHDALTGLPNKAYLEDAIRHRINAALLKGEKFGLLFIDIDRFKNINGTLGHRIGDILLRLFSERIQNNLQKQDILARIGGDEFIILISQVANEAALRNIAKRLLEESRKKFSHSYHEFNITVSIGVTLFPEAGNDPETLIRNADITMYQAKVSGRDRLCLYTNSLNHAISRRVKIENELHHAINNNEFEMHYQPIYDITNKQFNKVEALLRWNNSKLGKVSPAEFIPIAEDIGMMHVMGEWIIQVVAQQQCRWQKTHLHNIAISLNVSAKQLLNENFVRHMKNTVALNKITLGTLLLEITESFFLLQETVPEKLLELKNLGMRIAIDDFGTGYSNLHYLHKLHISYLKIDKSFIDQIDQENFNDSILLTIIAIGKRMNFKLIAEGVETQSQYQFLEKNGCDEIQGYYFSKPLPIDALEKFLK